MSLKEIMELKDEILKNNRELEIRLKSQIENYSTKFLNNISTFQKKINEIKENNNKVMKSIPDIHFQISKINQLEKFDLRVDNRLSSHDLRITTILSEIEKIKTKYDKIVLDNLYIPGHVGSHCKFQNLSEYLLFNVNEVSLLRLETEQLKKDYKNMKNKHDNTIKQIVNLIDGSVKRCNEYTDNKQKDFQLLLDTRMQEFNEKVMEIRMNVCKIQMKTEEECNNLNIEFNKILEEKKEFINFFQNKLLIMQKDISNLQKDYKNNINNIKQNNKDIEKEVKNIKNNIIHLIGSINCYQKKQNKNIYNSYNNNYNLNMSSGDEVNIIKGNRALMKDFEISNNKFVNKNNSVGLKNSYITKNRRDSLNKNIINDTNQFKRSFKKRNTMFYTGPILKLPMNNRGKRNVKDSTKFASPPSFYGLINPILHKIVDKPINKEFEKNNTNSDSFTIIYSDRNNSKEKDKNKNNDKNKHDNSKIMYSAFSSKSSDLDSESSSESESNSSSQNINTQDKNNTKKSMFYFSRKKKKSNSKQYFSKLSLKPNTENDIKKSGKSNSKLLKVKIKGYKTALNFHKSKKRKNYENNENNLKIIANDNNSKNKIKESISSIQSVQNKNNNKDITDILNKKIYLNVNNNLELKESKNHKISSIYKNNNNELIIKNNKNKYVNNEDSKTNNIINKISSKNNNLYNNEKLQNKNIIKNKNNNIKKNISPIPLNSIISNSKLNNLVISQKNNTLYSNNCSNTINICSSSISKNHKISKNFTPQNDKNKINNNLKNTNFVQSQKNIEIDNDTGVGYNIVSFDIPKNISLSSKKNQYYSLFGKKIQKRPSIKTEAISPIEEIYKQKYNKKLKLENCSNSNYFNDMPKKISPAFGRTAYTFYTKKDIEEFGGNITNSANIKVNNNANLINNNYNITGNPPVNIKYTSK